MVPHFALVILAPLARALIVARASIVAHALIVACTFGILAPKFPEKLPPPFRPRLASVCLHKSKISSVRLWPVLALAKDKLMYQQVLAPKKKSG